MARSVARRLDSPGPIAPKATSRLGTPLVVRRQAWWTAMAGGFHTYGQNQMWRMEPGWDKTFDTPGAAQVCLMKRTFTELP